MPRAVAQVIARVFAATLVCNQCQAMAAEINPPAGFLTKYCGDCHEGGANEGGLRLDALATDLSKQSVFARWERLHDRVASEEMPPVDAVQPTNEERRQFLATLSNPLTVAHAKTKGTVLRRLNRREYENTLNDVFGINADLADLLPEDGRSHEFDTVGSALGLSMVHLERYLAASRVVLDEAIATTTTKPAASSITTGYHETREGERFIGQRWKKLSDNAVVRFSGGGYPTGMIRTARANQSGHYRIKIRAYAYQSEKPITYSVGATSFARGSERPLYGFFTATPGKAGDQPKAIEFETWIDEGYMLEIEPRGIFDAQRYKRESIEDYDGPGLAVLDVVMTGPLVDEFPTRGHKLLFDGFTRTEIPPRRPQDRQRRGYVAAFDTTATDEDAAVRKSLLRVATKLFRRPASATDIASFQALYDRERAAGESIEQALRTAVSALLCSPRFLFLDEPAGMLDDDAIAARLSYFLTRSAPDDALLRDAGNGHLHQPATLMAHVDRLALGPRFDRFIADFCDSWLDLREIDFTIPDSSLFPEFDPYLRWSMPRETTEYVAHLIKHNRPARELVDSDYAMLNSRLAEHYDLPTIEGSHLRRVDLPSGSLRGGLLTQASLLKVTANGTNTSPVVRGAWVMERILGETPPPPPPGIPGVEPDIRGASTLRELLDKHRDQQDCNACHRKIDPPGFALETFNPIGGQRVRYRSLGEGDRVDIELLGRRVKYRNGQPVDASGELPSGERFGSFNEFRAAISQNERRLAQTWVEKLLTFATGREMGFSDRPEIERLVSSCSDSGYRLRDLLHAVVQSDLFLSK